MSRLLELLRHFLLVASGGDEAYDAFPEKPNRTSDDEKSHGNEEQSQDQSRRTPKWGSNPPPRPVNDVAEFQTDKENAEETKRAWDAGIDSDLRGFTVHGSLRMKRGM